MTTEAKLEVVVECENGHQTTTPVLHPVFSEDGTKLIRGTTGSGHTWCSVCDGWIVRTVEVREVVAR